MTEIDVEKFTWHVVKHKISWVPVTDAQNVGSDALSGKWVQESIVVFTKAVFDLLLVLSDSKLFCYSHFAHEKVQHTSFSERASNEGLILMHLRNHSRVVDKLNVTCSKSRLHNIVAHHLKIIATRLPKTVHNFEKLQYKIVLPQIVTKLDEELFEHGSIAFRVSCILFFDQNRTFRQTLQCLVLIVVHSLIVLRRKGRFCLLLVC